VGDQKDSIQSSRLQKCEKFMHQMLQPTLLLRSCLQSCVQIQKGKQCVNEYLNLSAIPHSGITLVFVRTIVVGYLDPKMEML
jgi:hypothetical protein